MDPSSSSPRRLRENEDLMQSLNERMDDRTSAIRDEDHLDQGAPVAFFCECSDLSCRGRIQLSPATFHEIHRDTERFVLLPGHEIPAIERVVDEGDGFVVVRKIT